MRNLERENANLRSMLRAVLPLVRAPKDDIEVALIKCAAKLCDEPTKRPEGQKAEPS